MTIKSKCKQIWKTKNSIKAFAKNINLGNSFSFEPNFKMSHKKQQKSSKFMLLELIMEKAKT